MQSWCAFFLFCLFFICKCNGDTNNKMVNKKIFIEPPSFTENVLLAIHFNSSDDIKIMTLSTATKDGVEASISKYDGQWSVEVPNNSPIENDYQLILKSAVKHHAISVNLNRDKYEFTENEFVLQYEVSFLNGMNCGGGYVKLLSASDKLTLSNFNDKTPYTIMFGPDKCDTNMKLHFIFRHENKKNGQIEEKHAKQSSHSLETYFNDKKSHLYTLVVRSDNSYEIYVDQNLFNSGNLLTDMEPPVNPPSEIEDPNETKPSTWDDRPKIRDEKTIKPNDWDESAPEFIVDEDDVMPENWLINEPKQIVDPNSKKPDDWDSETDGEWTPATIDNPACENAPGCGEWTKALKKNPKYQGKWSPPMITNPAYKGVWKPKRIANPNFYEELKPYIMTPISALGIELWSLTSEIAFNNFYVGTSKKDADSFAEQTWVIKHAAEKKADPLAKSVADAISEVFVEKPWVIAIVVFAVIAPIILCCVFCRSSKSQNEEDISRIKKTDEHVPDDISTSSLEKEQTEPKIDDNKELSGNEIENSDENIELNTSSNDESKNDKKNEKPLTRQRIRKE